MRLETFIEWLKPFERVPLWLRYVLAIALVVVAFAIWRSLGPALNRYPFLPFYLPIILSAALLGRGSGFVAVVTSTFLTWYFFLEHKLSFALPSLEDTLLLILFVFTASASAFAIEGLRLIGARLEATKQSLDAQLSLLNSAIDSVPEPMFVKDTRGVYAHVNSSLATIFGVAPENVIGHSDREFLPAEQAAALESVDREVLQNGVVRVVEERVTPAGESSPRTYLSTKAPWRNPDGSVIGLIGIARDIDARKNFEEQLRSAAELNRILLFDINHRMKNQLQSVSGLLRLAEREVTDDVGRAALAAAARRLSVLARVNDRLHLREGATRVRADDFIEPLCHDLKSSLIEGRPIALRTRVDVDIDLDPQRAVSLGLIINELVANALKYAFVGDRPGAVEISLTKERTQYCLEVNDNGTGMDRAMVKAGSGTRLVELLAQQLEAELAWKNDRGTQVRIFFAVADSNRSASSI